MSDRSRSVLFASALLLVAVALVYAPIREADFVNLDDFGYVVQNPAVRGGLTREGLRHVVLHARAGLWMPLTFASHMLDVTLFGLDPTGPHLVNVALHAATAVLLLLLLVRTTGAVAASSVVAVLFALHPLRVESVAWIAERKDVLSLFLALVTLHAWVDYARRPSVARYLGVVAGAALALAAKPMLVTLPALLFLFDCWPLRRLTTPDAHDRVATLRRLVLEKLPLVGLTAAAAVVTILAVRTEGGLVALADRSLATRLAHALVSLVWYVSKTAWPTDLAVLYPFPIWQASQVVGAALLVVATTGLAVVTRRRAPWIAVGLAWFAIALVPVIGLVQAGLQGMADRFTYLPSIGLLVAVVWTIDAAVRRREARMGLAVATAVMAAVLAVGSYRQVGYWRDSETLFERTLAVTRDNWVAQVELGNSIVATRPERALAHFTEASRLEPKSTRPVYGIGLALERLGRVDEAIARYREALRIDPGNWRAYQSLGVLAFAHDDIEGAAHHLAEAVWFEPDAEDAASILRRALVRLGESDADAERYLGRLRSWSSVAAADRSRPDGAAYGAALPRSLFNANIEAVRGCLARNEGRPMTPFSLYVAVNADGTLAEVAPLPPTRVARCVEDGLRPARVPAPPFAPFHTQVGLQFQG